MTDYRLPPGMTAKNLRFIADDLRSHNFVVFANTLGSWADAIDPPAPKSIATDEMVEAVHLSLFDGSDWEAEVRRVLEAAERLGWLRDPDNEAASTERLEMAEDLLRRAHQCSNVSRRCYLALDYFDIRDDEAEYLRSLVGEGE